MDSFDSGATSDVYRLEERQRYQELLQRECSVPVQIPVANGLKRSPAPLIDLTLDEDELERLHPRKKQRIDDLKTAPKTLFSNHKSYLNSRSKSPITNYRYGYKFFKSRNSPWRLFTPSFTPSIPPSYSNSIQSNNSLTFTASDHGSPASSSPVPTSFSLGISSSSTPLNSKMASSSRERVNSSGLTTMIKNVFGFNKRSSIPDETKSTPPQLPTPQFIDFNKTSDSHSPLDDDNWIKDLKDSILPKEREFDRRIDSLERKREELRTERIDYSNKFKNLVTSVKIPTFKPHIPEPEPEEEPTIQEFPELSPDMDSMIDDALTSNPTNANEVLCSSFDIEIRRKDMNTLDGLNWLNDEIINFYLNLIVERGKLDNFPSCFAFNTFFYPKVMKDGHTGVKRWTRRKDVFSYELIFIPVHLGVHWCLAVIDFKNKRIDYYDSMGGKNNQCLHALKSWVQEESLDKKKQEFPMDDWKLEHASNIPQQMNGSDCGMFALKFAEYVSRRAKINFTQANMPYFRRRMVYEILTQQLL